MIELPRALAGSFRSLLRKCLLGSQARAPCPLVLCQAGKQGLTLSCQLEGVALRHHSPGNVAADAIALPASLLAEVEGKAGAVTLEHTAPMKGRAHWQEQGAAHELAFETALPESLPEVPPPSGRRSRLEPGFLAALAEAFRTTAKEGGRAAFQQVLLRGSEGSVVATDGRQLLMQGGFDLPWKGDALIPALPAFAAKELPAGEPVLLARSDGHVSLEVGPWLLRLKEEDARHYPDVSRVLREAEGPATRLLLEGEDIEELARALPKMPGSAERFSPVTLELGAAVRLLAGEGPGSLLALPHSTAEGPSVRVLIDRRYLLRALRLGFTEVRARPGKPLLCQDGQRTYLWMPLDDSPVHKAADTQPTSEPAAGPTASPAPSRASSAPGPNGKHAAVDDPSASPPADPLAEAEALRLHLQKAQAQVSRLIAALRQQRRQSRAVLSAVASLRRLGQLDR